MEKKLPKLITLVFTVFIISSCSKEDIEHKNAISAVRNIEDEKTTTLKELGYASYEAMLNNGWEVIYEAKQNESFKSKARRFEVKSSIKEKLTIEQVRDLGYSDFDLKKLYSQVYNKMPSGVSINSYGTYGAVYPLITERYGWNAYVEAAKPKVTTINLDKQDYITKTVWVTNNSNAENLIDKHLIYDQSESVFWSVSSTVDLKIREKVGIPVGVGENIEVAVGLTAVDGNKTTIIGSYDDVYSTYLPPFSKRQIVIIQKVTESTFKYEFPINITGLVGLNFSSTVKGHYFWGNSANLLLKGKKNKQLGTIIVQKKSEVEIIAGPVIPL